MARTRPRRTRARRARSSPRVPDIITVWKAIARPELAGAVMVVLAAAAIAYLLPPLAATVPDARDRTVETLGLHAFTLSLAVAGLGALLALRRLPLLARHARHGLGMLAWLVFVAGLFGRWYPDSTIGRVDLAVHSAGGDAGRMLTAGPAPLAAWILTLPAGFALLWPLTTRRLLRGVPPALASAIARLASLRLHAQLWRWLRASTRFAARASVATVRTLRPSPATVDADLVEPSPAPRERAPEPAPAPDAAEDVSAPQAASAATEDASPEERRQRRRKKPTQLPMDMETPAGRLRHSGDGWQLPPLDLLDPPPSSASRALDNERRAQLIVETLASFGVDASVVQINEGPTVTQFGVEPGWDVKTRLITERDAGGQPILGSDGQPRTREVEVSRTRIRVNRITALQNDLALALAAPALRIEAPVPGKPMVGIEVPNQSTSLVALRTIMESPAYQKASRGNIPIALGAGVSGDPVIADLSAMPHLLIAGATGSGKSVCLNALISCLLVNYSPEEMRLVMIDPKRVELSGFANIPHLAFSEIVVEMDRVVGTLQAVINEMESRYRRFARAGVRNIKRFNEVNERGKLPYWVVIIDELADLMIAAPYHVENQLVRLAQLARATGIHLVVATQRPSVDVITGLIKANFPTRIAFAVSSQVDSRTILDHGGAEKLLGRGDMLFVPPDAQKPRRVQGVFVSDQEIDRLVNFWTADRFAELAPEKFDELLDEAQRQVEELVEEGATPDDDPMLHRAIELAREHRTVSTSMLQRKLRVGYPRAARLMDDLEDRGVVGPSDGSGSSREVLVHETPNHGPAEGPESLAAAAARFEPPEPPGERIEPPRFPRPFDAE